MSTEWMRHGACADHDPALWYPKQSRTTPQVMEAKAICRGCRVKDVCLAYALQHNENDGIWGGLTAKERRKLHKAGSVS